MGATEARLRGDVPSLLGKAPRKIRHRVCGASQDLIGPETTPSDKSAMYLAELWGATPLLGFVYWYPYIDLDDDNWPDANERLYDFTYYSEVDRLGNAADIFWVHPEEFFGERDLEVPDEMKVSIRAELYWSDPVESRVIRSDSIDTTITSSE